MSAPEGRRRRVGAGGSAPEGPRPRVGGAEASSVKMNDYDDCEDQIYERYMESLHNDECENQEPTKKKLSSIVVELLSHTGQGYHSLFATSCFADDIAASNDPEEYPDVLRNLLVHEKSAIGEMRAWFSPNKFDKLLGSDDHREACRAIIAMDEFDIPLKLALREVDVLNRDTEDEFVRCIYKEIADIQHYWENKENKQPAHRGKAQTP